MESKSKELKNQLENNTLAPDVLLSFLVSFLDHVEREWGGKMKEQKNMEPHEIRDKTGFYVIMNALSIMELWRDNMSMDRESIQERMNENALFFSKHGMFPFTSAPNTSPEIKP